jgi:hypothetical protein
MIASLWGGNVSFWFADTHPPVVIQRHSKQLVEPVSLAVQDGFYKTASEVWIAAACAEEKSKASKKRVIPQRIGDLQN